VRAISAALLLLLTGCAFTITYAAGKDSAARIYPQYCAAPSHAGEKRTEIVELDRKALQPDDVTTTTITEPAPSTPVTDVKGAAISKQGSSIIRGLSRILCFATLGILC
jgi:hypothetical protein